MIDAITSLGGLAVLFVVIIAITAFGNFAAGFLGAWRRDKLVETLVGLLTDDEDGDVVRMLVARNAARGVAPRLAQFRDAILGAQSNLCDLDTSVEHIGIELSKRCTAQETGELIGAIVPDLVATDIEEGGRIAEAIAKTRNARNAHRSCRRDVPCRRAL